MERALGDNDIMKELGGKSIVIRYADLVNFPTIERLLKYGNAVILYPGKGEIGHWTGVFYTYNDRGQKIIEFFDPYGISVDHEFKMSRIEQPHLLSRLLSKSNYPIEYNEHRFQAFAHNINTCGRHVIARIKNADMPLSTYLRLFGTGGGVTSDELITHITNYY